MRQRVRAERRFLLVKSLNDRVAARAANIERMIEHFTELLASARVRQRAGAPDDRPARRACDACCVLAATRLLPRARRFRAARGPTATTGT